MTTTRACASATCALVLEDFAPGAELADMEQVHGADVVRVVGGRWAARAVRRPGHRPRRRGADGAGRRLRAGAARRPARAASSVRRTPVATACATAWSSAVRRGACVSWAPTDLTAWVGPHVCGRCYEVPAALQAEVAAVEPDTVAPTSWGTPVARHRGRRAPPSSSGPGCGSSTARRLHPRVAPTSTPTAATAPRAGRFAGLIVRRDE